MVYQDLLVGIDLTQSKHLTNFIDEIVTALHRKCAQRCTRMSDTVVGSALVKCVTDSAMPVYKQAAMLLQDRQGVFLYVSVNQL